MSTPLRILGSLAALSLTLSLTGCGDKGAASSSASSSAEKPSRSAQPKSAEPAKSVAAPVDPASLARPPYSSAEGKFEVMFPSPGNPKESVKKDGNDVDWHDVTAPEGSYSVEWSDFANPGEAEGTMKVFAPTREADKIKTDKEVTLDGHKGRDIEVAISPSVTLWIRFVQDGKRVYKLGAGNKNDPATAKRFLDSFKISGA